MKRIRAACIQQTLAFSQKEDLGLTRQQILEMNRAEAEKYCANLIRDGIRHQIVSDTEEPDGTVVLHIRRQYNCKADVAEYFS